MDVPQVDVLVCDLHGALSVDVQVRGGHQVHVETLWKTIEEMQMRIILFSIKFKSTTVVGW